VGRSFARILFVVIAISLTLASCGSKQPKANGRSRPVASNQTTVAKAPSDDPVIAAAGDIACPTECASTEATADLLVRGEYTAVLTLGDNQYEDARLSEFQGSYDRTWGRVKDKTFPSPGNHDYHASGAEGYYNYFGSRAGPDTKGFYSFEIGAWHLLSLNSEANIDEQLSWVTTDLAAHQARCTLAYWHKPIWTSGNIHRDDGKPMEPIWRALAAAGVDVVLNGHVHNYERFAPRDGIREFVVGTGGRGVRYGFAATLPLSEVRDNSTDGILAMTLHPDGYDWRFLPVAGGSFTDHGTARCA
jgi:hypothetical protein